MHKILIVEDDEANGYTGNLYHCKGNYERQNKRTKVRSGRLCCETFSSGMPLIINTMWKGRERHGCSLTKFRNCLT